MSDVENSREAGNLSREGKQEAREQQDQDDGEENHGHDQATDQLSPGRDTGKDWTGRQGHKKRQNSAFARAATPPEEGPWQNEQRQVGTGAECGEGAEQQSCLGNADGSGRQVKDKDQGLKPVLSCHGQPARDTAALPKDPQGAAEAGQWATST